MHHKNFIKGGKDIEEAGKALVMLHGRGSNPYDILSLAQHLNVKDFALIAPAATGNTWYPYSFLASAEQNGPWIESSIELLDHVVSFLHDHSIRDENIAFAGFSQGACLALEYAARNARRWKGVVAFTGGLIGESLQRSKYKGDFDQTRVYIGTSDPDIHVPVERVLETAEILKHLKADVKLDIIRNMGHTIIQEEIAHANEHVFE